MGTYHSSATVVASKDDVRDAAHDRTEHVVVALRELAGACKGGLVPLAVGTGIQ